MAKQDTEVLVKVGGWFLGFAEKLMAELARLGVSSDDIYGFVKKGGDVPVRKIAEELAKLMKPTSNVTSNTFWPTWKIIKLGTGLKTADDFRKALGASGCRIGDWANDILGKSAFSAAAKESELELAKVSVRELGFKNGATRQEIYQRAQELGLKICPNEVGPQLRLQYKDQPNGEWVVVAMEPITDSDGDLELFRVRRNDDDQWLRSDYDDPDVVWGADGEFVFCK